MDANSISSSAVRNSYEPHLDYYGGRVLDKPSFFGLYLGNYWISAEGKLERNRLESFGRYLPSSSYATTWKEYGGGAGTYLGSSLIPVSPNKRSISDSQLRGLIEKARASSRGTDQTVYTVYLPPDMTLISPDGTTSRGGMGGYHLSYTGKDGKRVYYAAIAYSDEENGIDFTGKPVDNMTIAASHEWAEAVTDPDVNAGELGWYDERYGEIGDIPIQVAKKSTDIYGKLGSFTVQKEWSNRLHRSVLKE